MLKLTQARAKVRALVGTVLSGSAMTLALFATVQSGAPDRSPPVAAKPAPVAVAVAAPARERAEPRLIKAGFLPEFTSSAATLLAVDPFRGAPMAQGHGAASAADLECMTEAVYFESRGQPLAGQQAVAQVVMNRTRHPAYPKTVCGVTYQGRERRSCQFSYACHPRAMRRESSDYRIAREVAQAALDGSLRDVVGTATSFHATRVRPGWGGMIRVSTIGDHAFYKFTGAKGSPDTFNRAPQPSRAGGVGSLSSALMAAVKRPVQSVLHAPVVKTVTAPPAPVIGLPEATFVAAPSPVTASPVSVPPANVAAPAQVEATGSVDTVAEAAPPSAPVVQPVIALANIS